MSVYDNPTGLLPILSAGYRTIPLWRNISHDNFHPERVICGNVLVSECDFKALDKHRWMMLSNPDGDYAVRGKRHNGHWTGKWLTILMSREILGLPINAGRGGLEADHWNHDTRDNRRENLRIATSSQGKANRRTTRRDTRFKGVQKRETGFVTHVTYKQKHFVFRIMRSEIEAGLLYFYASTLIWGEYACYDEFPESEMPTEDRQNELYQMVYKELVGRNIPIKV